MNFDLSNPKILASLLVGGALPYFLPAIPATLTKWLLFGSVLRNLPRPGGLGFGAVAMAEPFSPGVAVATTGWLPWLNITGCVIVCAVYSVLAASANLLLFPSVSRNSGNSPSRRALPAFAIGLIYLGYVIPVAYLLSSIIAFSNPR